MLLPILQRYLRRRHHPLLQMQRDHQQLVVVVEGVGLLLLLQVVLVEQGELQGLVGRRVQQVGWVQLGVLQEAGEGLEELLGVLRVVWTQQEHLVVLVDLVWLLKGKR